MSAFVSSPSIPSRGLPEITLAGLNDLPDLIPLWLQHREVVLQPVFRVTGALEQLVRRPERGCCLLVRENGAAVAALAMSFYLSLRDGGRCALVTDCVGSDAHVSMLLGAAVGYASAHGILNLSLEDGVLAPAIATGAGFFAGAGVWRHKVPATSKQLA